MTIEPPARGGDATVNSFAIATERLSVPWLRAAGRWTSDQMQRRGV